jgi:hypothetical protein
VWNKVRIVKDPDTGKRVSRPNPQAECRSLRCRALRSYRENCSTRSELKAKKQGIHYSLQRAPKWLLSGLLRTPVVYLYLDRLRRRRDGCRHELIHDDGKIKRLLPVACCLVKAAVWLPTAKFSTA